MKEKVLKVSLVKGDIEFVIHLCGRKDDEKENERPKYEVEVKWVEEEHEGMQYIFHVNYNVSSDKEVEIKLANAYFVHRQYFYYDINEDIKVLSVHTGFYRISPFKDICFDTCANTSGEAEPLYYLYFLVFGLRPTIILAGERHITCTGGVCKQIGVVKLQIKFQGLDCFYLSGLLGTEGGRSVTYVYTGYRH